MRAAADTATLERPARPRRHETPSPRLPRNATLPVEAGGLRDRTQAPETPLARSVRRRRQRLAFRQALRDAIGYTVDAPAGEIGHVEEIRVAPYEHWPEALIVVAPDGPRFRVAAAAVARVLPRERRLVLLETPADARAVARPAEPWQTRLRVWQVAAGLGAAAALGGYLAAFVALALDGLVEAAPAVAAAGAVAGIASAAAWRKGGRSWLAAAGLGSFWFPLAVGLILSVVLAAR